ncbi:MAG: SDR family oxidoreductase [bacterium]|nr:SDR family oxidoreductase [bacterium]
MILVTGATGFLGKNLATELRRRNEPVRAFVRSRKSEASCALKELGIELAEGDITDEISLTKAVAGCQYVLHTAALVKTWVRDRVQFDRVNVEGLGNVLTCATRAGVQKIIYTSSFIALGPTDGVVADENYISPHRLTISTAFHNDYERTKYLADQLARKYANEGYPVVILYPGVIYGPGEMTQGNIVVNLIQQYLNRKLPGLLGDGSKQWNYVYVDDVVTGHILALEKAPLGARYILGGENASIQTFISLLESLSNIPAPKRHIPYWLAKFVAGCEEVYARFSNRIPQNTRGTIEIYKHDWTYTSAKAEQELGYTHIPLKEGLVKTLAWLKTKQGQMNY